MMHSRRKPPGHHLRAVLWFVVGVLVFQLIIGVVVDRAEPSLRDPEYGAKRDRLARLLAEHAERDWTLYLGSSRGAQGFAPRLLLPEKLAFNFAIPGGGPMLQQVIYDRLSREGFRPKELFLEVMPVFFNSSLGDRVEMRLLDTARLSFEELDYASESSANWYSRYRRWTLARAVPEWRHAQELRDRIGLDGYEPYARPEAPEDAIEPDGWQPVRDAYYRKQHESLHQLAHAQYDRFYPRFEVARGSTHQLHALIRRAQSDGVRVTLIVMPEAEHFRRLATEQHRSAFGAFLQELQQSFAVPLIDARDWVPDAEFFDGHHLFPEGAERFTLRLAQELANR